MRADHRIMGLFSVGCGDRSDDDAFSRVAHREVLRHPRIRAAHENGILRLQILTASRFEKFVPIESP